MALENVRLEAAVLGALIANNRAFDTIGPLRPEHFAEPTNQQIYRLMLRRFDAGRPFDAVTLLPQLELAGVCDAGYLTGLITQMVGITMVPEYAASLRDLALRRQAVEVGKMIDFHTTQGGSDTGSEVAQRAISMLEDAMASSGSAPAVSMATAANEAMLKADAAHRGDKAVKPVRTGLGALDERWGGLYPESLDLIGARPRTGKTAFASQCSRMIAGQGVPVGFFSLEVSREKLAMANLSSLSGIPVEHIIDGSFDSVGAHALISAQMALASLPIEVVDGPNLTLSELCAEIRRLKKAKGCRVFWIDHRSKIRRDEGHERDSNMDWYPRITDVLKQLAKRLGITICLLVQLSRGLEGREDHRPRMSDIEYAGEQDADNILLLYRPELHEDAPPARGKMSAEFHATLLSRWNDDRKAQAGVFDVIFSKRRFGAGGVARLHFHGPSLTISEPSEMNDDVPTDLWERAS